MSSEDDNESEDNESDESDSPVKIREDGGVVVKLDRRDCGNLQYFNDPDFSDFALEAVDVTSRRTWHLHRVLLAGANKYFDTMFRSAMSEGRSGNATVNVPSVELMEVCPKFATNGQNEP